MILCTFEFYFHFYNVTLVLLCCDDYIDVRLIQQVIKKALRETQNLRAGCIKAAQLLDVAKRPISQG